MNRFLCILLSMIIFSANIFALSVTLRINKSNSDYEIDYFITDHLGSTRVIVDNAGNIKEQNDYYPFGMRHENSLLMVSSNKWKFVGEELQVIGLIGDIDLGARNYDPFTGTFRTQDLLAETKYALSSYVYAANNPINYIDLLGLDTVPAAQVDWSTFNPEQDVMALDGVTVTARKPLTQAEANDIVSSGLGSYYISRYSNISDKERVRVMQAIIHKGQEDFLTSPQTTTTLVAIPAILGGIEGIVLWLIIETGGIIHANSLKDFKSLITQLSKPEVELTKQEVAVLKKLTEKFGGTLRYDNHPISGRRFDTHVHAEKFGKSIESRHIVWKDSKLVRLMKNIIKFIR